MKKSPKIEDASILQVRYYLYYLMQRGVNNIKGKLDYPLLKQSVDVELTQQDITLIQTILEEIEQIVLSDFPPKAANQKICKSCAYFDLCYI